MDSSSSSRDPAVVGFLEAWNRDILLIQVCLIQCKGLVSYSADRWVLVDETFGSTGFLGRKLIGSWWYCAYENNERAGGTSNICRLKLRYLEGKRNDGLRYLGRIKS